jgi:hypothetical protein
MFQDIKDFVNRSNLKHDQRTIIFDLLDHYEARRPQIDPAKLAAEDKRISDIILGAVAAYKQDIDYNKFSTILRDSMQKTAQDIGKIAQNVKSAVGFFSSPAVLVILVLAIIAVIVYVKVIK